MARRRGNNEGSIYRRKDGRWAGEVVVGYNDSGRPKRIWVYGRRREDVVAKVMELLNQRQQGMLTEPTRMTLGEWLDRWLHHYKGPKLRGTTHHKYDYLIRRHIKPALGCLHLRRLRTAHLQQFYAEKLKARRADGKGTLAVSTVATMHDILHMALAQAAREGLIPRNPADAAERPRVRRTEVKPLSREEVQRFLEAAKGDRYYAAFLLDITCGLRRGELLGLRWEDVNLERATLSIQRQLVVERGRPVLRELKTASSKRQVVLPRTVVVALRQHRTVQAREKLALGPKYEDNGLVFCQADGTRYDPNHFSKRFKRLLKAAGLPNSVRPHDMRHTAATLLLEAGEHPKVVQELLGHASIGTTMDLYSHVSQSLLERAAAKMDHILAATPSQPPRG